MKLYELPRYSYFYFDEDESKEEYFFDHLDGMYSVCFNKFQDTVHVSAYADVVQVIKEEESKLGPYEESTDMINLSGFIDTTEMVGC